jgi:hypothetical protein
LSKIAVCSGHLFFAHGQTVTCCECIGEPFASEISKSINDDFDRLVSCLKNARNILEADGYFYAKEINRTLAAIGRA